MELLPDLGLDLDGDDDASEVVALLGAGRANEVDDGDVHLVAPEVLGHGFLQDVDGDQLLLFEHLGARPCRLRTQSATLASRRPNCIHFLITCTEASDFLMTNKVTLSHF